MAVEASDKMWDTKVLPSISYKHETLDRSNKSYSVDISLHLRCIITPSLLRNISEGLPSQWVAIAPQVLPIDEVRSIFKLHLIFYSEFFLKRWAGVWMLCKCVLLSLWYHISNKVQRKSWLTLQIENISNWMGKHWKPEYLCEIKAYCFTLTRQFLG